MIRVVLSHFMIVLQILCLQILDFFISDGPKLKRRKKHEKLKNIQTIAKRKNQSSGKHKDNLLPLGPAFSGDVFKVLCSDRAWAWSDRGYPCGQEAVLILGKFILHWI